MQADPLSPSANFFNIERRASNVPFSLNERKLPQKKFSDLHNFLDRPDHRLDHLLSEPVVGLVFRIFHAFMVPDPHLVYPPTAHLPAFAIRRSHSSDRAFAAIPATVAISGSLAHAALCPADFFLPVPKRTNVAVRFWFIREF